MSATLEQLPTIIATALNIPAGAVRADLKMGDLEQWDSVAQLDLVSAVEAAYDMTFTAEEMLELTSVAAIRARLAKGS
jgi:acyl carrier protein